MPGILGKKVGMSRYHSEDGKVIPVTVIACEPNTVAQVKVADKDGHDALVLGMGERKNAKCKKHYCMKEFDFGETDKKRGDKVDLSEVEEGTMITVSGVTRGRGFSGVMKRWGFGGQPATHGHPSNRKPGSIGGCAQPGRVLPGKKMAGRFGTDRQTLKNKLVVKVDADNNMIAIKGPVPGAKGSILELKWD